ncbi:hypothetical protein [Halovivax gelatinilyticus]|uniref:hypothetical protein n=1 Tax=Halovivax gelatinilyticus TaxID=2961597 RepID=UPI0020CA7E3D|nr:hypothetical protein [Halovivax gelatinilyticus]
MAPPANERPNSTGPPDRQRLRLLERFFSTEPAITTTAFEPDSYEPRLLRAQVDTDRYPPAVSRARIDVRWFESGDFSFHYLETRTDERWECRWDRHPNAHNSRLHFHRPPNADEVRDLACQSIHPIDVASTVLAAIDERIERCWEERG